MLGQLQVTAASSPSAIAYAFGWDSAGLNPLDKKRVYPVSGIEIRFSGHSTRSFIMTPSYPWNSRHSLCDTSRSEPHYNANMDTSHSPTSPATHPWLTRFLAYERLDYEMKRVFFPSRQVNGRGQSRNDRYILKEDSKIFNRLLRMDWIYFNFGQ